MSVDPAILTRATLLAGLDAAELQAVLTQARSRTFQPGQELCRAGESGDRCWVITAGLVDVLAPSGEAAAGEVVARQRKGSTVGEVAAILGEPYPETVVASIRTSALELRAAELQDLLARYPQIVLNALRTLHEHLARARARSAAAQAGETVAVAVGPSLRKAAGRLVGAARAASPRPVTSLDRQFSFAGAVTAAGDLVSSHATVLLPTELDAATVTTLLRESDRVVALAGTSGEVAELGVLDAAAQGPVEVVLVGREAVRSARSLPPEAPLRIVHSCEPGTGLQLPELDLAWLGRHLTRTKIGLALGAGGAKGYAHVGVLQALEEAGYVVDYVAGSSIGAIVATYLALGAGATEIEQTLRRSFDPPTVAEIFKPSLSGRATGLEVMTRLMRETTGERTFADATIPLTIMSVDLTERAPAPLREGPLWEALLAATALAGVFRPHERGGHRFVDGLALVPVPTGALIEDGADLTVAVNLISSRTLPHWPGGPPPEPPPERRRRGALDDMLEVMDLSQLSESTRHTELADIPITPRFGPGEWRDFHLADQFLAAGRAAAERQLPALAALASPAGRESNHQPEGGGVDRADAIRL